SRSQLPPTWNWQSSTCRILPSRRITANPLMPNTNNQRPTTRIGYGFDSHEFRAGIPLKIGGVALAHDKGLAGHSDGDVLLHAITDALLGAIAAPDIDR